MFSSVNDLIYLLNICHDAIYHYTAHIYIYRIYVEIISVVEGFTVSPFLNKYVHIILYQYFIVFCFVKYKKKNIFYIF